MLLKSCALEMWGILDPGEGRTVYRQRWRILCCLFSLFFFFRNKFGVCFLSQTSAHKWFVLFYVGIILVGFTPSYPECQPWTDAFLVPFFLLITLSATPVPKEQTHNKGVGVCNKQCVCMSVSVYCKRSLEKKTTTKRIDDEWWIILFFYFWFDNIFLCRWKFWVCTDLDFFGKRCQGSCRIISLLPFGVVLP